jgi:hypothetical protein
VRFFRREIVDYILKSKKMLKNRTFSVFEDSTALNQNLLFELKDRPEVEAAWILGGSVWAILNGPEKNKKKIKVSINDNLDIKLSKGLQGLTVPNQSSTTNTPIQQTNSTWNISSSSPHPTIQNPNSTWNISSSSPVTNLLNLSTSSRRNSPHSSPTNTNPT